MPHPRVRRNIIQDLDHAALDPLNLDRPGPDPYIHRDYLQFIPHLVGAFGSVAPVLYNHAVQLIGGDSPGEPTSQSTATDIPFVGLSSVNLRFAKNKRKLASLAGMTTPQGVTKHSNPDDIDSHQLTYAAFNTTPLRAFVQTNSVIAPGAPTVIWGEAGISSFQFRANDLIQSSSIFSSQKNRLIYLMNLYQEYRLASINMEFKPTLFNITTSDTNVFTITNNTGYPTITSLVTTPWDLVALHDRNDTVVQSANSDPTDTYGILETLWNMEETSGALRFTSNDYISKTFNLNAYSSVSTNSDAPVGAGVLSNNLRPIAAPWVPTKLLDTVSGTMKLNAQVQMSTIKVGWYSTTVKDQVAIANWSGYTTGNGAKINIPLGVITWTYVFEFRMREFLPVFTGIGDAPAALRDEVNLLPVSTSSYMIPTEEKGDNEPPSKKPRQALTIA